MHVFGYDVQANVVNKDSVGLDFDYGNRLREAEGVDGNRLVLHANHHIPHQPRRQHHLELVIHALAQCGAGQG